MNERITLVSATVGLSNQLHDHVMRPHMMNLDPRDVDILMEGKLGNTGRVSPGDLMSVAARTGGVMTQADGYAFIEDGWGNSRGLCQLEFLIESNALVTDKMVVLGYISGGEIDYEIGIPESLMFVPIRVWQVETRQYTQHDGFIGAGSKITKAAQMLLNDPTGSGLHTIRPKDILENATGIASTEEEDRYFGGNEGGGWAGTTSGTLSQSGIAFSNVQNNSPSHYASSLLGASMRAGELMRLNMADQYGSLGDVIGTPDRQEISTRSNLFMEQMRSALGRTMTTMAGFEGFSFGEIAHVFENFTDVLNLHAADTSRFTVADSRIDTSEFGSSNMAEIIANELLMLSQYLLIENKLGVLHISGTNDIHGDHLGVNELPVEYLPGELMPLSNGLDIDLEGTVENIKNQLTAFFFGKYCSDYYHSRTIVSFTANMVLFGQTDITVQVNGDPSTERTVSFATYALNRFDPNLAGRESSVKTSEGFFKNLTNHFNF